MTEIKIKKEFLKTYVAFGSGEGPLGKRDDIADLAIIALEANDEHLLNFFEKIPTLKELKKIKTDAELKALEATKAKAKKEDTPAKKEANKKAEDQKIIDAAVPAPFNKNTKIDELEDQSPSYSE